MYLSDRDLRWAIETGKLIVQPVSENIDASSIDLHLDRVEEAKVWDIARYAEDEQSSGRARPELHVGRYHLGKFSRYLINPPGYSAEGSQLVSRRGQEIIIKPTGSGSAARGGGNVYNRRRCLERRENRRTKVTERVGERCEIGLDCHVCGGFRCRGRSPAPWLWRLLRE